MTTMIPANIHSSINTLIPAYQPIIGADHFEVTGFELLGRYKDDNHRTQSLGPLFDDPSVASIDKQIIDEEIRNHGIDAFFLSNLWKQNKQLFININPDFVCGSFHHRFLQKLTQFSNKGADPSTIVLEITEQSSGLHNSSFMEQVRDYRNHGVHIAIDDVGKGFSSLDRIANIKPDILKIDLKLVQKSTHSKSYQHVLHALSILAQRMGSDILFEGIESMEELEAAWKHGAIFYQGFLFSEAKSDFLNSIPFTELMQHKRRQMVDMMTDKLKKRVIFERSLNHTFSLTSKPTFDCFSRPDDVVEHFLPCLNHACLRVYVCDHYGNQISSNFIRHNESWSIHPEFKGKNWSYRPYFLKNIVKMDIQQTGHLSDPYLDVQTGKELYTFSYPVANGLYLFADFHE